MTLASSAANALPAADSCAHKAARSTQLCQASERSHMCSFLAGASFKIIPEHASLAEQVWAITPQQGSKAPIQISQRLTIIACPAGSHDNNHYQLSQQPPDEKDMPTPLSVEHAASSMPAVAQASLIFHCISHTSPAIHMHSCCFHTCAVSDMYHMQSIALSALQAIVLTCWSSRAHMRHHMQCTRQAAACTQLALQNMNVTGI